MDEPGRIAALLSSEKLEEVRQGAARLLAWVDAQEDRADLSFLGLEAHSSSKSPKAIFQEIENRHGDRLDRPLLLELTAALFHWRARAYHCCPDAVPFLRRAANAADDATQRELVAIYQRSCKRYDDGHREHSHTLRDVFIDEVFPRFSGARLGELLTWADQAGYFGDLGELSIDALCAADLSPADEALLWELLDRQYARVLSDFGPLFVDEPLLDELRRLLASGRLAPERQAKLAAWVERVDSTDASVRALRAGLKAELPVELVRVLEQVGAQVPLALFFAAGSALEAALARHRAQLPLELLLRLLEQAVDHHLQAGLKVYSTPCELLLKAIFSVDAKAGAAHSTQLIAARGAHWARLAELYRYCASPKKAQRGMGWFDPRRVFTRANRTLSKLVDQEFS